MEIDLGQMVGKAMVEELNALMATKTWTLLPPPKATNIIGRTWRVKQKADGSLDRCKARLVAKGRRRWQRIKAPSYILCLKV